QPIGSEPSQPILAERATADRSVSEQTPEAGASSEASTAVPPAAPVTSAPVAPSPVGAAAALATDIDWPGYLPEGMTFAAEDSWPFRATAAARANEPFLIFRGGKRWLLIRNRESAGQPIPRSAVRQTLDIGGEAATLNIFAGDDMGFKLVWPRAG